VSFTTAADVTPSAETVAFPDFYRAHVTRIYRALAVTLGNDDMAREAVDEAMTRAYANWRRVGALDNPPGWVFRVGLNCATSWWRKLRREQGVLTEERHPRAAATDPAAFAAREALTLLPFGQRAVIVCRVLLDLSTAETADALGISQGTVKSRLSRGLAALRQALEGGNEQ
jgi:RNA polymerase sigma factor (sigma-70 family)